MSYKKTPSIKNNKKLNTNKVKKLKSKVYKLMDKYRVKKQNENNVKLTHISFSNDFFGRFSLTDKKVRKKFYKYLGKAVDYGINFTIAEIPKKYGPIKVDIDLEIPKEDFNKTERLYNNEMILKVIELYRNNIIKYCDIENKNISCCVFEKKKPTERDTVIRDGFHLIFPYVCINYKLRHIIRNNVVKEADTLEMFKYFSKNVDNIFDKQIVSSNGWLMYGSAKPNSYIYKLTRFIDYENKDLNTNSLGPTKSLIKFFSLQDKRWKSSEATVLYEKISKEIINNNYNKLSINRNNNENINNIIPQDKDELYKKVYHLISLLSDERADNYMEWMQVGWALHNIDKSFLSIWINFSKQSKKFKIGECEKKWKYMRDRGYTMRSIMYWAKQDNYTKYIEYMNIEGASVFDNLSSDSFFTRFKKLLFY